MKSIAEQEKEYNEQIEEKARADAAAERERSEAIERFEGFTEAQFIAARSGRPIPKTDDELGELSMADYIAARKAQKQ